MGKQRTVRSGNFCVTVVRQSLTEKNEEESLSHLVFLGFRRKDGRKLQDNWVEVREGVTEYLIFKTL